MPKIKYTDDQGRTYAKADTVTDALPNTTALFCRTKHLIQFPIAGQKIVLQEAGSAKFSMHPILTEVIDTICNKGSTGIVYVNIDLQ